MSFGHFIDFLTHLLIDHDPLTEQSDSTEQERYQYYWIENL